MKLIGLMYCVFPIAMAGYGLCGRFSRLGSILEICFEDRTLTKVKEYPLTSNSIFNITDKSLDEIAPEAFSDSNFTTINIDFKDTKLSLTSNSFKGLSLLKSLRILSGKVTLDHDLFIEVCRLHHLELIIESTTNSFGTAFSKLTELETLQISGGNFTDIGNYTFSTISENLNLLELKRNNIGTMIPLTFARFKKLMTLIISKNKFTSLRPGTFDGLDELRTLEIISNNVTLVNINIFNYLRKLDTLNLENNNINIIAKNAFAKTQLTRLSLRSNNLNSLDPLSLNGLDRLVELNLSENKFTIIPKGIFSNLTSLKILDLSHNIINKISPYAFSGMKIDYLHLFDNDLMFIGLHTFTGLTVDYELDISQNPLARIGNGAFQNSTIHILYLTNSSLVKSYDDWDLSTSTKVFFKE